MKMIGKKQFPFKTILSFLGPGFLVTIGFIDPGNWATNMEGGTRFGYDLLWVITLSTLMLIIIQHMSAKLGIATGKSLAVNIREGFPRPLSTLIGITIFIACMATDVAEILGGAIGFRLLFGVPLWIGGLITVFIQVFLIISQRYHRLEAIIIGFLGVIGICYIIEILIVKPDWGVALPAMIIPKLNRESVYVAMAILGAVVMPHNIFLHSNIIHTRKWGNSDDEKRQLINFEKIDTIIAMTMGWIVNSSMVIVAASTFFRHQIRIESLEQASATLKPIAGHLAGFLFSLALVFAGVSSSVTSSMAEANVITGFLGKPEDPKTLLYKISVVVTAIPAFAIIVSGIDTFRILVFSQVVLSIQLPFTMIPLVILCRRAHLMHEFRTKGAEFSAAIVISAIVIGLNLFLLYSTLTGGS